MPLHTCEVTDVCGHTHILRDLTLSELHGRIGPQYPIILDGKPGYLTMPLPGHEVVFRWLRRA
jgi:hypothetical protein